MNGKRLLKKGKWRGFTLVELLIAMSIYAAVALASFTAIQAAIRSADGLVGSSGRQSEIQDFASTIILDMLQIRVRTSRNQAGVHEPAFFLMDSTRVPIFLRLTRQGLPSIGLARQTGLQRVYYALRDNTLYRGVFEVVDGVDPNNDNTVLEYPILTDVEEIEVKATGRDNEVSETWPKDYNTGSVGQGFTPSLYHIPQSVVWRITLEDQGEFEVVIPGISGLVSLDQEGMAR